MREARITLTVRLAAEFQPERAWLFGSHAWGQPDEGSDLDLLVVVPHSDELPARQAQRASLFTRTRARSKTFGENRAELERFRHVRSSLEAKILEHGRLIYG